MSSTYYNMTDSTGASGFLPTVVFDGSSTGVFTSAHRINQLSSIGITGFYEADFSNTVTRIDVSAFAFDTKVVVATINGVTSIRSDAFYGCTNMRSITLDCSVNTSNQNYMLTDISSGAFQNCTSLRNLHIPETVKIIPDNLCNGCTGLELAVMGHGRNRSMDTYITTGRIGRSAFANCSKLSYFIVPETVGGINDSAFANDVSLALVYILGRPDISANAFTGAMGTNAIYYFDNSASYTNLTAVTSSALFPPNATPRRYQEVIISGPAALTSTHVNTALTGVNSYWKGKILEGVRSFTDNCFRGQTAGASGIGTTNYSNMIGISFPANNFNTIGYAAFCNSDGTTPVACNVGGFYIPRDSNFGVSGDVFWLTNATGQALSTTKQFVFEFSFYGSISVRARTFQYSSAMAIVSGRMDFFHSTCFQFAKNIQYFNFFQKNAITSLTYIDGNGANTNTGTNAFSNCFNALTSHTQYLYMPRAVTAISASAFLNSTNPLVITGRTNTVDDATSTGGSASHFSSSQFSGTDLTFHIIVNGYDGGGNKVGGLSSTAGIAHLLFYSGMKAINAAFNHSFIKTITIPDTLTDITSTAFLNCTSLTNVYLSPKSNLTTVGASAFSGDVSLTSFFIPNSLRSISRNMFGGCTNLASVSYGNNPSIAFIDVSGFANTTNKLTSIFIPSSVVFIGNKAFMNNNNLINNLTTVRFGAGSRLKSMGGVFGTDFATPAVAARYLKDLALPNGVRSLGGAANDASNNFIFRNSFTLANSVNLILPSSLECLPSSFLYCDGVTTLDINNIYLPKSITNFPGPRNHYGYINSGVIGTTMYSFYSPAGCLMYLPSELSTFTASTLTGTNRARSYYKTLSYTANPLTSLDLGANVSSSTDPMLTTQIHADIKDGVTVIGNGTTSIASANSGNPLNLISVNIPSTVTDISANAFNGCSALAYVTFSENSKLTKIRDSAFSRCTKISDITLPETLTTIGENAFNDCTNLATVSIPYNVTSIGQNAFFIRPSLSQQLGNLIEGEYGGNGSSESISLSSDGTTLAMGSWRNGGALNNGTAVGHVRVYKYQIITDATWANYNATDFSFNGISPFNKPIVVDGGDAAPVPNKKYWVQLGGDIDGEAAVDYSGWSVSLSSDGMTLAIGARNTQGPNGMDPRRGHTRVYNYQTITDLNWNNYNATDLTFNSTTFKKPIVVAGGDAAPVPTKKYWVLMGGDIDGEYTNEFSGTSVSLSSDGQIVAIGATSNYGSTSGAPTFSGVVRVYKYQTIADATWTNYNATDLSYNGTTFSKPIVIAGGDAAPVPTKKYWVLLGGDINAETIDSAGFSVSLNSDGTIVAIGGYTNDGSGNAFANCGHVRIYQYDANKNAIETDQSSINFGPVGWRRLGNDIDGEAASDESGYSVSLSADGTIVAIGAIYNDGTTGTAADNRGHVRVYKYQTITDGTWTNYNTTNFNYNGTTFNKPIVAAGGDAAPVPTKKYWVQLGGDIDGKIILENFGKSVSLSKDGMTLAIGAYGENTSFIGAVRVFRYDSAKTTAITDQNSLNFGPIGWKRVGTDITLINGTVYNKFGWSVSLNSDGTILAIGAYHVGTVFPRIECGGAAVYNLYVPSSVPVSLHERLYNDISGSLSTYFPNISTSSFQVIPALQLTNTLNPSKLTISQINNIYIRYRQSQLGFCTMVTVSASSGGILSASDITTALSGTIGFVHLVIGTNVTSIAASAAVINSRIYSIAISETVVTIGDNAFNRCVSLTYLSFHPDSVCTTLGSFAFGNASAVSNRISDLVLPDSLTTIGQGAFQNSTNLTSVCIPNKVTSLGSAAFSNCTKLTSVALPVTLPAGTSSYFNTNGSTAPSTFTTYSTNSGIPHFKLSDYSMPNGIVQNVVDSAVTYIDHLAYAYYPDITLYAVTTNKRTQTAGQYTYNVNNVQTPIVPAMHLLTALTYGINTMFPIYRSIPDLNAFSGSSTAANWADDTDDYYILMPGYSICIYNNLYDEENIYINAPTFRYYDNEFGLNPLNITVPAGIANTTSSILIMYKGRILSKYFTT